METTYKRISRDSGNYLGLRHKKQKTPFEKLDLISKCSVTAEHMGMSYGKFMAWLQKEYPWEPNPASRHFGQQVGQQDNKCTAKPCKNCGRLFVAKRKSVRFCSPECQEEARINNNRKYRQPGYAPVRTRFKQKVCTVCGAEFNASDLRALYCGNECRLAARRERRRPK